MMMAARAQAERKTLGASVVACCYAPPVFEAGKAVLDDVAFFVSRLVVSDWSLASFSGWDAGCDPFV